MREATEENRQKQIDVMEQTLNERDREMVDLRDRVFKAEEKVLDLKFEKETFDLQYARLQKRITDLENYKLQAS